jgi:homoserine acetyltransferase
MAEARRIFEYPGTFRMRRGGELERPAIAYETWGDLSPSRDNAVLLFTGLSPSAHASSSPEDPAPGWWEEIVGPSRPIDSGRYFVICMNSLGSCFGSTGPAAMDPVTGETYRLRFPVLTLEDVASAGKALLDHLGIDRLDAVVGASMGGMTALAYAMLFSGSTRSLLLDPFALEFEIESYLEAHARKFIGQFDANCYLYLSRAMDLFDVAEHGGTLAAGLATVDAERAMVVGVTSDYLFPVEQQRHLADELKSAGVAVDYQELESIQGHDSFLVDMDRFRPTVQSFFSAD